jgi:hypothetical protein
MLNRLIFKTLADSNREKQKDYRNTVIMQILIVVFGLTISEPVIENPVSPESKLIISIFLTFSAAYVFLLWDLFRNFTDNRALVTIILVSLSVIFITGSLVEFPYYQVLHVPDRRIFLLILHSVLFPIEITVIGFAIRDIFSGGFLTPDKLWGAACVYLMIGISFGSLYHIIDMAKPGSLGVTPELGMPNYSECIAYSFSLLGGVDPGTTGTSHFVRNISILEGIWGALYSMLIIGKLLGLPRQESENQQPTNS